MNAEILKRLVELERRITAAERALRLTDAKIVQARETRRTATTR